MNNSYTDYTQIFLAALEKQILQGYKIIPLVGAGVSIASGIPAISDLSQYIKYCIASTLNSTNITTANWPPLEILTQQQFRTTLSVIENNIKTDDIPNGLDKRLAREAYGAMEDWRSALLFLSRLSLDNKPLKRVPPDYHVTDSFFLEIIRNASPNICHRLLAHLSMPLRSSLILTTNFDNLLETALSEAGRKPTVFSVHLDIGLPDARSVSRQLSVIKLHGDQYGLRANYSLDLLPSQDDQRHFASYFTNKPFTPEEWFGKETVESECNAHMFVIGASASETRTCALIKRSLARLPEMKIFWVCYSANDLKDVRNEFGSVISERFNLLQHSRPDLLLLQLFQTLKASLPPSGIHYPSLFPLRLDNTRRPANQNQKEIYDQAVKEVEAFISESETRIILLETALETDGGSSVAATVYKNHETIKNCIWLDLDDFDSPKEMFIWLTAYLAQLTGKHKVLPVPFFNTQTLYRQEIENFCGTTTREWCLFFDARSGPGSNLMDSGANTSFPANHWTSEHNDTFWTMIDEITAPGNNGDQQRSSPVIKAIVTRYKPGKADSEKTLESVKLKNMLKKSYVKTVNIAKTCISFNRAQIHRSVIDLIERGTTQEIKRGISCLIYALVVCRRTRHSSLLHDELPLAFRERGIWSASKNAFFELYEILKSFGLLSQKQGGFLGIDRDMRDKLVIALEQEKFVALDQKIEINIVLSDWYYKLFYSSGDPTAALECVHHHLRIVKLAKQYFETEEKAVRQEIKEKLAAIATTSLTQAQSIMARAKTRMIAHGYTAILKAYVKNVEEAIRFSDDVKRYSQLGQACISISEDAYRMEFDVALTTSDFGGAFDGLRKFPSFKKFGDLYTARIALAVRSYNDTIRILKTTFKDEIKFPIENVSDYKKGVRSEMLGAVRLWGIKYKDGPYLERAIRALRRLMYCYCLQAQAFYYAEDRHRDLSAKKIEICTSAKNCGFAGLELIRLLSREKGELAQREQRHIYTQLALAESMASYGDDMRISLSYIEAARTIPGRSADNRSSSVPSVIDLFSAEVLLVGFAQDRHIRIARNVVWQSPFNHEEARREISYMPRLDRDFFRRLEAVLRDANSILERAKMLLTTHRRSLAWWTKAYEIGCKTNEFMIMLFCLRNLQNDGHEEQYGGQLVQVAESTLRNCVDAQRVINVDVLQCARILESALNQIRWIKVGFEEFSQKKGSMREVYASLKAAIDSLKKILVSADRRQQKLLEDWRKGESEKAVTLSLTVDENVDKYVKFVQSQDP